MLDEMDLGKLKSILVEWRENDEESCFDVKWAIKLKTKDLYKFGTRRNRHSNKKQRKDKGK